MEHLAVVLVVLVCLASPADAAVEIEFWTVDLSPAFDDYINGMIEAFEATHPDVTIDWQDVPFSAIQQRLLTSIAGNVAPDVVNLNQIMSHTIGARGGLADLRELIPADELADYSPGMIQAYTDTAGRLLALPWYSDSPVFYYNPDIMRQAGLDPQAPPQTLDEIFEAIVTVYEKTGIQGYFPAAYSRDFVWALGKHGIPVVNEDGTQALFNSPDAVALLERVRSLVAMGAIPREMVGVDFSNRAVDLYASGRLWMGAGATMLRLVRENNPSLYERTVVGPDYVGTLGHPRISSGWALAVTAQSKTKKEAAEWAVFVTNTANQIRFTELATILPVRLSAAAQLLDESAGSDDATAVAKRLQREQMGAGRVFDLVLPEQGRLFEILNEYITLAALGDMDTQAALDRAVAEWNQILSAK